VKMFSTGSPYGIGAKRTRYEVVPPITVGEIVNETRDEPDDESGGESGDEHDESGDDESGDDESGDDESGGESGGESGDEHDESGGESDGEFNHRATIAGKKIGAIKNEIAPMIVELSQALADQFVAIGVAAQKSVKYIVAENKLQKFYAVVHYMVAYVNRTHTHPDLARLIQLMVADYRATKSAVDHGYITYS
jgi:hypothetical protein